MSHRDWKGRGWYRMWNMGGKYEGERERLFDNFAEGWTYEKQENFKPPAAPDRLKEELPDGLYAIRNTGQGTVLVAGKVNGRWAGMSLDPESDKNDHLHVIGRIPTEPV